MSLAKMQEDAFHMNPIKLVDHEYSAEQLAALPKLYCPSRVWKLTIAISNAVSISFTQLAILDTIKTATGNKAIVNYEFYPVSSSSSNTESTTSDIGILIPAMLRPVSPASAFFSSAPTASISSSSNSGVSNILLLRDPQYVERNLNAQREQELARIAIGSGSSVPDVLQARGVASGIIPPPSRATAAVTAVPVANNHHGKKRNRDSPEITSKRQKTGKDTDDRHKSSFLQRLFGGDNDDDDVNEENDDDT